MKLLVSVRDSEEAGAAFKGGADVIDAKDPVAGALGAVSPVMFEQIVAAVDRRAPVSAALGDADDTASVERRARAFAADVAFVKIGFAGLDREVDIGAMIAAAVRGASSGGAGVVAVAYADHDRVDALSPDVIARAAASSGASGLLLDTAMKDGPGLRRLWSDRAIRGWVARVQSAGLFAALAGQVRDADLSALRETGADIVGIRGAACVGSRSGTVSVARVQQLAASLRAQALPM